MLRPEVLVILHDAAQDISLCAEDWCAHDATEGEFLRAVEDRLERLIEEVEKAR